MGMSLTPYRTLPRQAGAGLGLARSVGGRAGGSVGHLPVTGIFPVFGLILIVSGVGLGDWEISQNSDSHCLTF